MSAAQLADPPVTPADARARFFLLAFLLLVTFGIGTAVAAHVVLARSGLLPAPPLTATACIDEKFLEMRDAPLADRTLLAVGSSATWRNLDAGVLERRFPGTRAYNAAPCYLHIDQAAFLADFLLDRTPQVDTVLAIVAPRDFEGCPPGETAFFDPDMLGASLSGAAPSWLPYVSGFRPPYLLREARAEWRGRDDDAASTARHDRLGSAILTRRQDWRPALTIDPGCYAGLSRLEAAAAEHGARLVVATLPVMPEWGAAQDPGGTVIDAWTARMRAALTRSESLLVDTRALGWGDDRFADPVHVLFPHHTPLTEFVADAMAAHARTTTRPGDPGPGDTPPAGG